MASRGEILQTLISSFTSLKVGQSISVSEITSETDLHHDAVQWWVNFMKDVTELNLGFSQTKGNQIIITKQEEIQDKINKILKLIKKGKYGKKNI